MKIYFIIAIGAFVASIGCNSDRSVSDHFIYIGIGFLIIHELAQMRSANKQK